VLFPQTAEIDVAADPDKADSYSPVDPDKAPPPPEDKESKSQPKKGVLRDYIESFDQQTLADTARCGTCAQSCEPCALSVPQYCSSSLPSYRHAPHQIQLVTNVAFHDHGFPLDMQTSQRRGAGACGDAEHSTFWRCQAAHKADAGGSRQGRFLS
jgi:ferredoxin